MNEFENLCESCPLFQDWEPKKGDRYFIKNTLYIADSEIELYKYYLTTTKPDINDEGIAFKEGIHYLSSDNFGQYFTLADYQDGSETLREHSFWLPYIHQLQNELLQTSFPNSFHLLSNFFKFAFNPETGIPVKYYDHESLWVLFYAYENWYNWDINTESWEEFD